MKSKDVVDVVKGYFGVDFTIKSRKGAMPVMRAMCNKLCRKYTNESFESIGDNYVCGDHATIMHSIRKLDATYINDKTPFNVSKCYDDLDEIVNNFEEKEFVAHSDKNYVITKLQRNNRKLKERIESYKEKLDDAKLTGIEGRFKDIIRDLSSLTDVELSEFHETRMKPYKKALESRRTPKKILNIKGAMLNR